MSSAFCCLFQPFFDAFIGTNCTKKVTNKQQKALSVGTFSGGAQTHRALNNDPLCLFIFNVSMVPKVLMVAADNEEAAAEAPTQKPSREEKKSSCGFWTMAARSRHVSSRCPRSEGRRDQGLYKPRSSEGVSAPS